MEKEENEKEEEEEVEVKVVKEEERATDIMYEMLVNLLYSNLSIV